MMARCYRPSTFCYERYGGRGIKVCQRWHIFENFLADMGERPFAGASVDRIDFDGDYEPANCRWATQAEQNRNRCNNVFITFNGVRMVRQDWARRCGVDPSTLRYRLWRGWPLERALTTPGRPR